MDKHQQLHNFQGGGGEAEVIMCRWHHIQLSLPMVAILKIMPMHLENSYIGVSVALSALKRKSSVKTHLGEREEKRRASIS